jgi:DNA (cytosine-5)-methyltransferase 1
VLVEVLVAGVDARGTTRAGRGALADAGPRGGYIVGFVSETDPVPTLLSCAEIASRLGITEQRVRSLFRSRKLAGQQVGSQWVTTEDALSAWMQAGRSGKVADRKSSRRRLPDVRALSFFTGAMGLDLGLERAGIHVLLACETDKHCRATIAANRPEVGLIGDIWGYGADEIRSAAGLRADDRLDVMVGGPPCQAFSTAGARRGFKDQRGNAFLRYLELILELRPRYAVIENVRGLLSAPMTHVPHEERGDDWRPSTDESRGGALLHVLGLLQDGGYRVTFNLYNAANFGVPQQRERVIMICCLSGSGVPHLMPTHSETGQFGLPRWRTLRDALGGLPNSPCDHLDFPEERLRFYRMLKPGQYWKHLPADLQKEALGGSYHSGGGKTGFYRRLSWDLPSCTLVTSPCMPATDICHPVELRPLSVQEYKRIQQFPDDWVVCGKLTDQYRQVGNAVPVGLGEAVGRAILAHSAGKPLSPPQGFPFSRYRGTDEKSWQAAIDAEVATKRSSGAKPPAGRRRRGVADDGPSLFTAASPAP